jgi:protein-disulfide isomerase
MTTTSAPFVSRPFVPLLRLFVPLLHPVAPLAAWSVLAAVSVCLTGCGPLGLDRSAGDGAPTTADSAQDSTPAVIIDGRTITISDLNAHMQEQFIKELLEQPEDKIFELRENAIRDLVQKHVVEVAAAERGVTPEALFEEITSAPPEPTIEEVSAWYGLNQSRLRGARLEDIASHIKDLLANEAKGKAWSEFVQPKINALDWEIEIDAPRQEIAATHLIRGAADAPITIMSFSDYQCPYCIRSEPVLAEVLKRYPDSVRLIHRHFPLDSIHPFARPASEAAMCADEQGKFWEFHDAIFALEGRLDASSFLAIGGELELDLEALGQCLEDHRYEKFVRDDLLAGQAAGVTGTPAFFVNGIALKGARDADDLSRVVDSELSRMKAN